MDAFLKVEKEEKDTSKEDSNWSDHDVTDLNGLLIMVKPGHCAVDHQNTFS